jgi:hypothetical protein
MTKKLNIPDELLGSFKRLMYLMPYELRNNIHTQKVILLYLKFGGAKLAQQGAKIIKMLFNEQVRENPSGIPTSRKSHAAGIRISGHHSKEDDGLEFPTK